MSAQGKESAFQELTALRELTDARTEFAAAEDKLKKAEAKFIELTEGANSSDKFILTDKKKSPQEFTAGKTGDDYKTDC